MNVRNVSALIAVATTAGVVGPILIEKIAGRFALTRLLLGETGPSASSPTATGSRRKQEPASTGAATAPAID